MSIEIVATLIGITLGLGSILNRVGTVYHEIKETKTHIEFVHKDLLEMKLNDKEINARLNHMENFLTKTSDFVVR